MLGFESLLRHRKTSDDSSSTVSPTTGNCHGHSKMTLEVDARLRVIVTSPYEQATNDSQSKTILDLYNMKECKNMLTSMTDFKYFFFRMKEKCVKECKLNAQ